MSLNKKENATSEVQQTKESEIWSRFSVALHILLPVAGLAIFLKQKHILSRLLLQLDRKCVSVYCPSFSKREKLLRWAGSRLPQTWSSQSRTLSGGIAELWTDGSLLCTLINSAIPGACLNPHRHWKKPPLHAQAVAYKYLGVVPIFTEKDLLEDLTVMVERKFLQYLNEIQQAILKLTERNDLNKRTSDLYIARGMGLYTGEQHRKTIFYIYQNTSSTICNNTNIIIHIRGPYGTYGKAIIPKFHSELFATSGITLSSQLLLTKNLLQNSSAKKENAFMKNFSLPFMHYHKKHLGDNIVIHITMEDDRAKVTYIPQNYGMYEIIMISNGELIRGCPYNVHILNNTSGIQETLEREEKEEEIPHARKRKIISKTIDFIDEQMPMADLKKKYKINTENKANNINNTPRKSPLLDNTEKSETDNKNLERQDENNGTIGKKESLKPQNNEDIIVEEEEYDTLSQENVVNADNIDSSEIDHDFSISDTSSRTEKHQMESVQKKDICNLLVNNAYNNAENTQASLESNIKEYIDVPSQEIKSSDDEESVEDRIIPETRNNITNCPREGILTFNEYPKPIVVNKIHIPEKFAEFQNLHREHPTDSLNTKHFKNVTNCSSKREIPRHLLRSAILQEDDVKRITKTVKNYPMLEPKVMSSQNDDNDSGHDTISSLEDNDLRQNLVGVISREKSQMDIEKMNVVPKRFFYKSLNEDVKTPTPLVRQNSTSPICPDLIVPEVNNEHRLMSVAEKRKIFANQPCCETMFQPTNSSLAEEKNIVSHRAPSHFQQYEGLSVLNFIGSLKKTENIRKSNNFVMSSTKSLPNISLVEDDYVFHSSVKDRKQFWETLSSSSTSLNSANTERKTKRMTEEERLRLIWKKPNETGTLKNATVEERTGMEKDPEISKSADNIISITKHIPYQGPKKYKSLDDSLDNCTMVSIEERKRMLLRQNYENEKTTKMYKKNNKICHTDNMFVNTICEEKEEDLHNNPVVFCRISEKIKEYDCACNLTNEIENVPTNMVSDPEKKQTKTFIQNQSNPQDVSKQELIKLRSHFKKAIRYFKELEEKSLGKNKTKRKVESRRESFDLQTSHHKNRRKGGSLNIPNVSERFSINSLYKDVFGTRKGSFKGAPNRSALVEALATFSRKENGSFIDYNEDDIKYDIFKKRAKSKKRKSVRSIFDVYY